MTAPRHRTFAWLAGALFIGAAIVAVALVLAYDRAPSSGAGASPAYSAHELTDPPTKAWITNGGTVWNQRFSPLSEVDHSNVSQLKGVWMTHLGSATAAKYSAEAQPLFENGVIYVPTGDDDVFAVDVQTGQVIWHYDSGIDQEISTICCGWLSRGVALGDGRVYIGQLDGKLVALDQKTGAVDWTTTVGDWRSGYTITAAPLYFDGRVITGVSGGEFSIRGRVQAYDAKTGKLAWQFHTTAGPGTPGHETWPETGDAWEHGGAPVWQTPAVDPDLGLLYFSTGNASPDLDGSRRAGDNLFTASIVAVDVKTGAYRWHFQQVHHDIWDYDSPSPIVLFDGEFGGTTRKALAETSKTGWTYVLDRETGRPLLPIVEEPVPQDAAQATSATQPIPQYPSFIPRTLTQADIEAVTKLANAAVKGKTPPTIVPGPIYTPFGKEVRVISPGPQGGVNWQPMSYSAQTGYLYICSMRSVSGYTRSGATLPPGKQGEVADVGSVFTTTGFGVQTGYFGAWDPTTGRIAWRHRWPESCYSGTVTTAGTLVFVGRNSGELEAYDAATGSKLWGFQTGAGANTTVTVFEHDGHEMVAFLAGGNALAASPHGDNLWLFSLDGTLGPAPAPGTGEGTGHAGENSPGNGAGPNIEAGQQVFSDNCSGCHGLAGHGGNGGPTLADVTDRKHVIDQVTNGGGGMPAFGGTLSDQQIQDVAEYVTQKVAG